MAEANGQRQWSGVARSIGRTNKMTEMKMSFRIFAVGLGALALAACSGDYSNQGTIFPDDDNRTRAGGTTTYSQKQGGVFGEDGLTLFGGDDEAAPGGGGGGGIGVNSFLWRASLDTVSFMPLASADPFGGVIITDWYTPSDAPGERFKVNVYILGRDLRADGLRASVFRQRQDETGGWSDAGVAEQTNVDLENAILTRARQLRIAQPG